MNKKTWIIFVVITIGILGGLIFLSRQNQASVNVDGIDQNKVVAASAASGNIADHVFGPQDGQAILIEYGDFQCPACASTFPILKELKEEFKDELTFVFRNNPITQIHPNARAASAAAEAAGLQGKFWEMHDVLYENQDDWSSVSVDQRGAFFERYAKEAGVADIEKFKTDMESSSVSDKINFDLALAKKVPVEGTPTLLLNGEKIESDVYYDKDKFRSVIEEALK